MIIDMSVLLRGIYGLEQEDVERWILNAWVRPDGGDGHYMFREIDVARVRLIRELRVDLQVNEDALPVVLLLLDQLYDVRRQVRDANEVVKRMVPEDIRQKMLWDMATRAR
jgi:chaperone modulatory protein CbpM